MPFAPSMVGTSVPSSFGTPPPGMARNGSICLPCSPLPRCACFTWVCLLFCAPYARFLEALAELLASSHARSIGISAVR